MLVPAAVESQRPLRVCLATGLFPPAIGGEERHASLLARALSQRGHAVTVVTQRLAGTPCREVVEGVRVERVIRPVHVGPLFAPCYIAALARFLLARRGRFDIIQPTYLYWDAVTVALLKPVLGSRLVVRMVVAGPGGDLDRFSGIRLWPLTARYDKATLDRLARLVARRADAFVCLNPAVREEAGRLGVRSSMCDIVPNGIEVSRFAREPRTTRNGDGKVVCVARLVPQKGIDVLLRAFATVRTTMATASLTILGEGPERENLTRLAADLGLTDAVRFCGAVPNVAPHLAAAGIFVLASRFEGFPLALLEAMAAGLPVVATSVPGNVNVIRNEIDGLFVPPDDPPALAEAMFRLMRNPDVASRLGEEARRRAASEFSVDTMAERTLAMYRGLFRRDVPGSGRVG